ncbi:TetR/AcrR family transcriptional regulator [Saccharothrix sp. ST-888]|uniref:TetR/AcrR family transcriptional regulator n=1 Tax=Saccharothrix sp. ST-888 TaxID=1427391 RepID=UPI0005ECD2D2|nr:helix-turn-helix domain-containing protein [Saccharothrix sp. ST-888]KJK58086.1 hypothetical protein UK12_12285 [Saccharothrix sp. ST-888]
MTRVSQEHHDGRRRQILDGARRCFLAKGFRTASMQDVAADIGLSTGAVYSYFAGQDELIAEAAAEALARTVIGILQGLLVQQALLGPSGGEAFREGLRDFTSATTRT